MNRTLAIGDVHGCLTALDTLLGQVRPGSNDQLIFLGDYIDRGPDSKGVLDRLIELRRSGQVETLRGNHEVMMISAAQNQTALRFWLQCGGREALLSYSTDHRIATLEDIPTQHWRFITKNCIDWYETDTHIFAHANVKHDVPMQDQHTEELHWNIMNANFFKPHVSGKTLVCGHTEQHDGKPLSIPGAICIDTWAYGEGWLTCLCVETGEYWQANESGDARVGWI